MKMKPETARSEMKVLMQMHHDISFLKQKIVVIEEEIGEISSDLHRELNPEFLNRLEKIQKQKGIRFGSVKEFEKYFS